jgi:uncharacterized protein (TIGR03067 family)
MTRTSIVISLFAAFTATACALAEEPDGTQNTGDAFAEPTEATVWQDENTRYIFNTGDMLSPDHAATEIDEGLCACTTRDCEQQYVEDNWGCGLCVDAVCGDGSFAGGCFPCEEDLQAQHSPAPVPWEWVGEGAEDALEITDEHRIQDGWLGYMMFDQDTEVWFEVSGSNYTLKIPRTGVEHAGRFVLDTTTAPSRLTMFVADSSDADLIGTTVRAVYQLQGIQLAMTVSAPEADFPADIVDGGETFVFYRK